VASRNKKQVPKDWRLSVGSDTVDVPRSQNNSTSSQGDSRELLENLNVILDSIDEGIHVVDRSGVTVLYNKVAAELDNLREEEVVGKHILEVFPSLSRETSTLLQVLKTGQAICNREQTFTTYKGDTITTVNSTLPVRVDGRLVGAVEVSRNITLMREMAHRIVDLQTELFGRREGRREIEAERARYTFRDIVGESESILELKRKAARSFSSRLSTMPAREHRGRSSHKTAPLSPKGCWKESCSERLKAVSLEHRTDQVCLSLPMEVASS